MYTCSSYAKYQYDTGSWSRKYSWSVITKPHILQQDSSSCGVLVMKVYIATCVNACMLNTLVYANT